MSDETELTSYAELAAILQNLPMVVREARRSRRLTQRQAAEKAGLSASTLCRLEKHDGTLSMESAIGVLAWLDGQT